MVEQKLVKLFKNEQKRKEMQQIVKAYIVFKTEYGGNTA
jgi:hypothetical protein